MMTGMCGGCDLRWSGERAAHCARCHRHFSTDAHHHAHLIVDDGTVVGCADPATLKNPLRLSDRGVWKSPPAGNGPEHWSRAETAQSPTGAPGGDSSVRR